MENGFFAALARFADFSQAAVRRATGVFAAVNVLLIAAIVLQVVLRRGFSSGLVMIEEAQWHLYAVGVMFGIAYAQSVDSHIRVDALARFFSPRAKAGIECVGILLLALPFFAVVFLHGIDFVADSWRVNERSDSPVGLPARWAIKSLIPAAAAAISLSLIISFLRNLARLGGAPETGAASETNGAPENNGN